MYVLVKIRIFIGKCNYFLKTTSIFIENDLTKTIKKPE